MSFKKLKEIALIIVRYIGLRALLALICLSPLVLGICVMLSGEYERAHGSLVPRYLWDDDELIRKHLFTMSPGLEFLSDRYGAPELETMSEYRRNPNVLLFMGAHISGGGMRLEGMMPAVRDYNDYKASIDSGRLYVSERVIRQYFQVFLKKKYSLIAEEMYSGLRHARDVPQWLLQEYPDQVTRMTIMDSMESLSLAIMNNDLGASYIRFDEVKAPVQSIMRPARWRTPDTAAWRMWSDFVRSIPSQYKWLPGGDVYWRSFLRRRYQGDVNKLNTVWSSSWKSFSEVPFRPADYLVEPYIADWDYFVRFVWPRDMISIKPGFDAQWQLYLESRLGERGGFFADIVSGVVPDARNALELPAERPADRETDLLWCDFVESDFLPLSAISIIDHAQLFGPFQRGQYVGGSIVSLNEEWHTSFKSFDDLPLPIGLNDLALFPVNRSELRKEYAGESWFAALGSLDYPSGIVKRTAVLTGGMVLVSLFLSVICAYILARLPFRGDSGLAIAAIGAALVPVPSLLVVYGVSITESLGGFRWIILSISGISAFCILILRESFLEIIKKYREMSCIDGISESGFVLKLIVRHCWHVMVYALVLHVMVVYCAVDWQVLTMGRLWNWTLGVWGLDHASAPLHLRAAAALIGLMPVLMLSVLVYPVLSRYCLMPQQRHRSR